MPTPNKIGISKRPALIFVLLMGVISLFADMTYEGARSITGPFLALLGANALTVGVVAGLGEFIGYGLRLVSGYLADRTQRYWMLTVIGYFCNLLAVPLLALANHWWLAAVLIILERLGKGIRTPPRDAMLSYAGQQMGMGWGFGLHESLDQMGALLGPLIIALVLYLKGSYHECFAILLIPAVFALTILLCAQRVFPNPQHLAVKKDNFEIKQVSNKVFWLYLVGAAMIAAGYADFSLIAYHFTKLKILPNVWLPIAYAIAMGVDGFTALLLGKWYDKKGFIILIMISIMTSLFAPLVFFGSFFWAMLGIILWSIGVGAHETLMRAVVANMMPTNKRASAYGVFNFGYGLSWLVGSVIIGALYDVSILLVVIFSMGIQLAAIPFLIWVLKVWKE